MFRLCKFTSSDDIEEYEGYTNDTQYNKWDNVILTRSQLENLLSPYDVRFLDAKQGWNDRDYPIAVIYWDDETETIESSPFVANDGAMLEGYYIDYEFIVIEN